MAPFREMMSDMLLKLGLIALFAGLLPVGVQVYDWLTCNHAAAVVEFVRPDGKVEVGFADAEGRRVSAVAASHHVRRMDKPVKVERDTPVAAPGRIDFVRESGIWLPPAARRLRVGERVDVIYRRWSPSSLAPHRKLSDMHLGFAGMAAGALLLAVRSTFFGRGGEAGGAANTSVPREHKPAPRKGPRSSIFGRPAAAGGRRRPAVERNTGWF
ncbi:MAG: hypothetical protein JNM89_08190 [Hyphomicrobiaceae bacterium]|nr:hypothetical protein [Hyphomicrobiaceae bacterium]